VVRNDEPMVYGAIDAGGPNDGSANKSMNEIEEGGGERYERMEDIESNTYVYTAAKTPWMMWPTQTRDRKRIENKKPDEVGEGDVVPARWSREMILFRGAEDRRVVTGNPRVNQEGRMGVVIGHRFLLSPSRCLSLLLLSLLCSLLPPSPLPPPT